MAYIQKRGDSYYAQVRKRGFPSKSRSFPTKSLAIEWARKIEAQIDQQRYSDVRPISSVTLAELIYRYIEEIGGQRGFGRTKEAVLNYLTRTLGHLKVSELTPGKLQEFTNDRLKAGVGGVTIGMDLTYLKGVLKVANELWNIRTDLDAVKVAKASLGYKGITTKSRARDRRPTQSEIDRLVEHFNAKSRQLVPMADIILFAIETAMRQGEITRITWDDLNIDDRTIIIRDRKHPREKIGNDCEVPLLGTSFDIVMRQAKKLQDRRIFPYHEDTISTTFTRACSALGILDLRFHDLRHEGVSRLFEKGYTIEQVSLVSGHKDWAMLRRYTQLRAKDLHKVFPRDLPATYPESQNET